MRSNKSLLCVARPILRFRVWVKRERIWNPNSRRITSHEPWYAVKNAAMPPTVERRSVDHVIEVNQQRFFARHGGEPFGLPSLYGAYNAQSRAATSGPQASLCSLNNTIKAATIVCTLTPTRKTHGCLSRRQRVILYSPLQNKRRRPEPEPQTTAPSHTIYGRLS